MSCKVAVGLSLVGVCGLIAARPEHASGDMSVDDSGAAPCQWVARFDELIKPKKPESQPFVSPNCPDGTSADAHADTTGQHLNGGGTASKPARTLGMLSSEAQCEARDSDADSAVKRQVWEEITLHRGTAQVNDARVDVSGLVSLLGGKCAAQAAGYIAYESSLTPLIRAVCETASAQTQSQMLHTLSLAPAGIGPVIEVSAAIGLGTYPCSDVDATGSPQVETDYFEHKFKAKVEVAVVVGETSHGDAANCSAFIQGFGLARVTLGCKVSPTPPGPPSTPPTPPPGPVPTPVTPPPDKPPADEEPPKGPTPPSEPPVGQPEERPPIEDIPSHRNV